MDVPQDEETAPLLANQPGNPPSSPSLSSRVHAALARPASLNGLEKLLAAIAVFLLLLTATFAGLFAGEAVKLGKEERHHRHEKGHGPTATSTLTGPTATVTATPTPRLPGNNVSPTLAGCELDDSLTACSPLLVLSALHIATSLRATLDTDSRGIHVSPPPA